MVFGGFAGDYLKDVFVFKHNEGVMIKSNLDLPIKLFAYQMPTVSDPKSGCLITGDWQSKKILMFRDQRWILMKDLQQN